MNIRERHRAERWRRWREGVDDEQRETNPRTAGGRAWPSSPIDVFSSGTGRLPVQVHDPEINGSRFTRVHTVTVEATSGQTLPESGGPVQWQPAEDDPEGPLGFVTFRGATPTAVVTCDITGVLAVDLEWRWADQGSGEGRFRTKPKVTLRRNRQGDLVSRSWVDPQPGPGGDARHLGLTVQGRDEVEVSLPHEAGSSKELGPARATFTLWETGPTPVVEVEPLTGDMIAETESALVTGSQFDTMVDMPAALSEGDLLVALVIATNGSGHDPGPDWSGWTVAQHDQWTLEVGSGTSFRDMWLAYTEVTSAQVSSGQVFDQELSGDGARVFVSGVLDSEAAVSGTASGSGTSVASASLLGAGAMFVVAFGRQVDGSDVTSFVVTPTGRLIEPFATTGDPPALQGQVMSGDGEVTATDSAGEVDSVGLWLLGVTA